MLNFKDEILNYEKIELNYEDFKPKNLNEYDNIIISMLNNSMEKYEKISKQTNKTSSKIDDIIEILEENKEANEEVQDKIRKIKAENEELFDGIIRINSLLEGMYLYSQDAKEIPEEFKDQIGIIWNQLEQELIKLNINRIGKIGAKFDNKLYNVVGVENNLEKEKDYVLKVVRYGYTVNGSVIRRADVIVNS